MSLIDLAERGVLPDRLIRLGIRHLLAEGNRRRRRAELQSPGESLRQFLGMLRDSPIAIETDSANRQHYEVPTEFFRRVLGPRMKYSCNYYPSADTSLAEAEEAMLGLFCERAEIENGMDILELGCGWGSLGLWIARNYPHCRVRAISNSRTQREFITAQCRELGIGNLTVETANVADYRPEQLFDRVVSIEMFEHVRNHELLMSRIADCLVEGGKLMLHIFCHHRFAYPYETEGEKNWMGRHFFTGGVMPSVDLLLYFQRDLLLEDHWRISGLHYSRTLEAWLSRCDAQRSELLSLFERDLGDREGKRQLQRWRMFFMACSELFADDAGLEWFVSHYRFIKR